MMATSHEAPKTMGTSVRSLGINNTTPPVVEENVWIRFLGWVGWYQSDMAYEEKMLVLKLDLSILIYGCLSFFTKYLDQQALTNAYVSGMREELKMHGNQLNYVTITWQVAYCAAMIPVCYYVTRYPANLVLPSLELGWGLATFGLAWAHNVETVYALRFFVGLFETAAFTGTVFVIGSWYKPREIGRRVALFFISSPVGIMWSGYLQAAAYTNLNGVHGLSGWRWLFIIDAIITLGIACLGFVIFPDRPAGRRPLLLTEKERLLSIQRLVGYATPPGLRFTRDIFRRVLGQWHLYAFVLQWILVDQNSLPITQPFSLYLKAYSPKIYSVVQVNTLPTATMAVSAVSAVTAGVLADKTGRFWLPCLIATVPCLIGIILLNIWNVGLKTRLAAFMIQGFIGAQGAASMGWATVAMQGDAEQRAIVTASMHLFATATVAATHLYQYPASSAPRWKAGFGSTLATMLLQPLVIVLIWYLSSRDAKRKRNGAGGSKTDLAAVPQDVGGEKGEKGLEL